MVVASIMKKHQQPISAPDWLDQLAKLRGEKAVPLLKSAVDLYDGNSNALLEKGLGISDILLNLRLDNETLACAIAYPALQSQEIHIDSIIECLGESSSKLLHDAMQMQALGKLRHDEERGSHQLENLRKMLLAMVTDVRAVLIVLAERLWQLRQAKNLDQKEQRNLALETQAVFAPLANRLGVWQIKWEMEDLCLRYTQPVEYKEIATGIASRRDDREVYIKHFIKLATDVLHHAGIQKFEVTGRVKHIYSIYKKMKRKGADLKQIYDKSAIRVLVDSIEQCYEALSALQSHWHQIPEEFDDYVASPKTNGYRSIHIVLIGPENHNVEVQIRTFQMHQESELGVAAHWRYKEGVLQTSSDEAKIALLRELIEWQKEMVQDETKKDEPSRDLFADRIYVFTPTSDIIDLPKGATPLDFAYTIHSEVGHRCRGAKVNGHIVPLIYELQMGQRVEILTAKEAHPSRDWLNPHFGYIKSARSRAKIQHWFREKDSAENPEIPLKKPVIHHKAEETKIEEHEIRGGEKIAPTISTLGINNLLTHIAHCCKPLPGDAIVGYVTRNRGLSIHRKDCNNIREVGDENQDRLMEVSFSEKFASAWSADLLVKIEDRSGLLRELTTMLANEKINIQGLQTQRLNDKNEVALYLTVEVTSRGELKTILELLKNTHGVIEARRR